MRKILKKFVTKLAKLIKSFYNFLKENGFVEELIRGLAKIILLIIVFYLFGQYVW